MKRTWLYNELSYGILEKYKNSRYRKLTSKDDDKTCFTTFSNPWHAGQIQASTIICLNLKVMWIS
jgi:hypothetical protein